MLFPSAYFGAIPYFQELAQHNNVAIDYAERFQKQTWRSRTEILTGNGPLILSIPTKRPYGKETTMADVEIVYDKDWRKDHWKAIESAYMHAPFYFYYGQQIEAFYHTKPTLLVEWNKAIFTQLIKWLDLDTQLEINTKNTPFDKHNDLRTLLNNKKWNNHPQKKYIQVFSDKLPFHSNLSILDLLMNEGPLARKYLFQGE